MKRKLNGILIVIIQKNNDWILEIETGKQATEVQAATLQALRQQVLALQCLEISTLNSVLKIIDCLIKESTPENHLKTT